MKPKTIEEFLIEKRERFLSGQAVIHIEWLDFAREIAKATIEAVRLKPYDIVYTESPHIEIKDIIEHIDEKAKLWTGEK